MWFVVSTSSNWFNSLMQGKGVTLDGNHYEDNSGGLAETSYPSPLSISVSCYIPEEPYSKEFVQKNICECLQNAFVMLVNSLCHKNAAHIAVLLKDISSILCLV